MRGDEPYFRAMITRSLKKHFRRMGYDVEDVDGASMPEETILDTLDEVRPGAPGKLVTILNAEKIKDKKGRLAAYVSSPTETVIAVFDASGGCDTKLGEALAAKAVVFDSVPFKSYSGDIEKWIQDEASTYGRSLGPQYAAAIRANVGTDLFALSHTIKKVVLHADGKVITEDDLKAVITKTASSQIYEFTNAFGERSLKKAFAVLNTFYTVEDDPSLLLCSALSNSAERLLRAKSLLAYGLTRKDASAVLEMNPYVFQNSLEPQLKKWTEEALVNALTALCEMDLLLKGSALNKRVLVENFLSRFLDAST